LFREWCIYAEDFVVTSFHHGDCVGADADADDYIRGYRNADKGGKWYGVCTIIIHPGPDEETRAHCGRREDNDRDILLEPKNHFARNRDIVDESTIIIACPRHTEAPPPKTGGGTWQTIEYARKKKKPIVIIWPNGWVEKERL